MRIAIVGSRGYKDLASVESYVAALPPDSVIISGGALGVDGVAESAARRRGLRTVVFPADWDNYGKSAGFKRNVTIVTEAEKIVCFWDGRSAGARNDIDLAIEQGKPLEVYPARLFKTTFCHVCTFWLNLIEHGEWKGNHKVAWYGVGRGECCGVSITHDGVIEWED